MGALTDPEFTERLMVAYAEVEETPGIFVMGLAHRKGKAWRATLALDDLIGERRVHPDDPSLYVAENDDAPTAVLEALAKYRRVIAG